MRKPELLAPAGGPEQLEYAIRFGADAVYLATQRYGMRARACNFKLEELDRVVAKAHAAGVKVHVTCNIMMHEDDLEGLPGFFERVQAAGADAVIVGDLGAIALARKHAPKLDVHVSTQASVCNSQAALAYARMGAKRIVCAREMSLADVARLRKAVGDELELECFVHGSMCMAYSGRCLISDFLTERSALAGRCTQPCRWGYTLEEGQRPGEHFPIEQDDHGTYIMNACDLNMLSHLDELAAAGIDSVKIEGRNKKAFYVATVVNAYRQVLDGADASSMEPELECVSHRPYSTGFFYGPAHQATRSDLREASCELAAIVVDLPAAPDAHRAIVRCRNAFTVDDDLELLSPGKAPARVHVRELAWVGRDMDDPEAVPQPCGRANRTMELYSVTGDVELSRGDILRRRLHP